MKHKLLLFMLSFVMAAGAMAQRYVVTGTAVESRSKNAVDFATAVLLRSDSTAVTAATTAVRELSSQHLISGTAPLRTIA